MNWTSNKPSVSGYYWLACDHQKLRIVEAWGYKDDPPYAIYICGDDSGVEIKDLSNALWSGPLIPPEAPKD